MVSTLSGCLRGCALVGAAALLVGCTRVISGTVQPVAGGVASASIPVADLLIEPGQFPARYRAVVLDATAVYRALQDVDGVAAASIVDPPQCAPPPRAPLDTAAMQGIDSEDASSLIVTVTRPAAPLRGRAEQLTACPAFTAVQGQDASAVTVTLLPAPPGCTKGRRKPRPTPARTRRRWTRCSPMRCSRCAASAALSLSPVANSSPGAG
jgi:hypothetical protein